MPTIRIITTRLPQPDRHHGAVIEVSQEKAASLIAQGFAEAVEPVARETPAPTKRRRTGGSL